MKTGVNIRMSVRALAFLLSGVILILPKYGICGDLEPPSGPAPTMYSLEEIYDKLISIENAVKGGCTDCFAPVPRTGQNTSYASGDDGELQKGVVSPSPRFTDNGDGTVTDRLTGLVWLRDADCFGQQTWDQALFLSSGLTDSQCGLTDGSVAGDWRLPNIRELQSLIDYGNYDPALPAGNPFLGVRSFYYWSSTTLSFDPDWAWAVPMYDGIAWSDEKAITYHVWCVRGPQ